MPCKNLVDGAALWPRRPDVVFCARPERSLDEEVFQIFAFLRKRVEAHDSSAKAENFAICQRGEIIEGEQVTFELPRNDVNQIPVALLIGREHFL